MLQITKFSLTQRVLTPNFWAYPWTTKRYKSIRCCRTYSSLSVKWTLSLQQNGLGQKNSFSSSRSMRSMQFMITIIFIVRPRKERKKTCRRNEIENRCLNFSMWTENVCRWKYVFGLYFIVLYGSQIILLSFSSAIIIIFGCSMLVVPSKRVSYVTKCDSSFPLDSDTMAHSTNGGKRKTFSKRVMLLKQYKLNKYATITTSGANHFGGRGEMSKTKL